MGLLRRRWILSSQRHALLRKMGPQPAEIPGGSLALGVAELRAGNPKGALTALELAAGAFNLRCAGAAHAIAAVALGGQLGQHDLARQRLAQGREAFQQLTDGNRQGLGPNWHEMILLDMALQLAGPQVARLEPDTEP
jgi:hypothetical protein